MQGAMYAHPVLFTIACPFVCPNGISNCIIVGTYEGTQNLQNTGVQSNMGPACVCFFHGRCLAALSISGWVCGVGDRHLGNILLTPRSGGLVAIDFGYSFGAGTTVSAHVVRCLCAWAALWCTVWASWCARCNVCAPCAQRICMDAAAVCTHLCAQLLPIPELVPFRLTKQLTDVLAPLDGTEMLQAPMTTAMKALQVRLCIRYGFTP